MAKPAPILSPDTEKAHFVAQAILCVLAAGSVFGVIWAIGDASARTTPAPVEGTPALLSALESLSSANLPPPPPPAREVYAPPAVSSLPPSPAPPRPSGTRSFDLETPSVPEARKLKNPQVIEAVEAARAVRRLGDMAAALESLRAADLREPNHPEIMGEMALTYEAMGLAGKAASTWRDVLAMGEAVAGGYHTLARAKLDAAESSLGTAAPPQDQGGVTLGDCRVIRDPNVTQGERITVRVPILAAAGTMVDPSKMDIHVFLFEQINDGERIEQVRAETPAQNWVSAPVDWKDSEGEAIDVTYDLTPPKAGEVRDLGKRSFHGFIVKLFYKNRLAGEQSQPQSLLEFTQQSSAPVGVDNSLFPK